MTVGLHARGEAMPGQAAGESPGFIAPMLATAVGGPPPDAAEFVAEVKWDGLRACIAVTGERVRACGPGPVATSPPPILSSACSRPRPGARLWSWTVRSSPCPDRGRTSPCCSGG